MRRQLRNSRFSEHLKMHSNFPRYRNRLLDLRPLSGGIGIQFVQLRITAKVLHQKTQIEISSMNRQKNFFFGRIHTHGLIDT